MTTYVLDASAWIRLFVPDGPIPAGLEEAVGRTERGEAVLAAPDLVLVEIAHVLHRKRSAAGLSDPDFARLWKDVLRLPVDIVPVRDDIDGALQLASELNLTVYDACYAALARRLGARLITADDRLARAARRAGLAS